MKIIKDITIKATYSVGFGNLEVPNEVYDGLCKIEEEYHGEIPDNIGTCSGDKDISAAFEWLTANIESKDAFEWSFDIIDMED